MTPGPGRTPPSRTTGSRRGGSACATLRVGSLVGRGTARGGVVWVGSLRALRTGQGKRIDYDGEAGKITNVSDANQYLLREPRKGWVF